MADLTKIVGVIVYVFMGSMALWGAFCCVMVWARVAQKRFKNEKIQDEFLDTVDEPLSKGDFDDATGLCEGDPRAIPQLAMLAVLNRNIGFTKARQLVEDRFQRDILADLEHRLTWVHTIIKSAPMVGLFGTVTGMMGAFDKLATSENVKPDELAENISFALVTTACGLAIAIPLIIAVAAVNIRIRKMEELTVAGINRFLESFQAALKMAGRKK
ncbi:MAG: MotA/TolQ/ExbB proton channel family protein [Pirellulaceae bacterium]|jgi:biopolymer transport protein ExbB/TolQ|nr:MotA/TolQ/ExbB proton channel family protein [Pirellulaceae bacterium]HJN10505.1 MotA/TolQ/ExbB proton channel family protein [Pirellulaceae bacterium]